MGKVKFAVTPGFEVGGTIFTSQHLAVMGAIIGADARVEMTTFKQMYVEMDEERAEEAKEKLREAGLEIYPAGFYAKSLITCNFCRGPEEAGLATAKALDALISGKEAPSPLKIGYSGCALGTGEPLLKDIGVVKMRDTFDIYVGGEGKGLKATLGTLFLSGLQESEMLGVVAALVKYFQQHAKKKEKFSSFLARMSLEKVRREVA